MKSYSQRKGNSAAASHAACAIAFWLFAFAYLRGFQADVLAYSQHVLSGGATHYDPNIGTVIITFTLYLLHLGVYALTRLRGSRHVLTYVPSLLAMAFLTSGGTHLECGFRLGVWAWLMPLALVVWGVGVYAAVKIPYGHPSSSAILSRPLWVNLVAMCAMFLFVGLTGCADDVFHYRLRMERLMTEGRYAEAARVGERSEATDSCLTMLRAYALARQGLLGERLFSYPVKARASELVPTDAGTHCVLYPADSLYRFLGALPLKGMEASAYLKALQQQHLAAPAVADYVLCGYLVERNLDAFVEALPRYYAVGDSLPRHYREALTLYTHTRSNPSLVYHNAVMDTDYKDFQALQAQHPLWSERRLAVHGQYGATYWWYYTYGDNNSKR